MAKVRRKAPRRSDAEDLSQPTRWRKQHGDFSAPTDVIDPVDGRRVYLRRATDMLADMERRQSIDKPMRDAGDRFHLAFRAAALGGIATTNLMRESRSSGDPLTERMMAARRRLHEALDALGGMDSVAGCCAWHVLGEEMSIREWARREGWRSRPVHHVVAQGVFIAALGVLVLHYRLQDGTIRRLDIDHILDDRTPNSLSGNKLPE